MSAASFYIFCILIFFFFSANQFAASSPYLNYYFMILEVWIFEFLELNWNRLKKIGKNCSVFFIFNWLELVNLFNKRNNEYLLNFWYMWIEEKGMYI